jgi:hypothetical protein
MRICRRCSLFVRLIFLPPHLFGFPYVEVSEAPIPISITIFPVTVRCSGCINSLLQSTPLPVVLAGPACSLFSRLQHYPPHLVRYFVSVSKKSHGIEGNIQPVDQLSSPSPLLKVSSTWPDQYAFIQY